MHDCPDCGLELASGARACRECGLRIDLGGVFLPPLVCDDFEVWHTITREASADAERG